MSEHSPMRPTATERFWAKVDKRAGDACWPWLGAKETAGYGRFYSATSTFTGAHRFSYELLVGPIPEGLQIDHLCCNTSCVNPGHLEPVTHAENMRRAGARRTHCKQGHALTEDNTYYWRTKRKCRTCRRVSAARTQAKRVRHGRNRPARTPRDTATQ